jgi:enoyl-CoA hydratase/carnithine racemase
MKATFDTYSAAYPHVAMRREDGILELRLHSEGESLIWGEAVHAELPYCFDDVGRDPENRVVILTGTGDKFIAALDDSLAGPMTPDRWQSLYVDGIRILLNLLQIEVPVITAVNGPASVHAELAVLNDIVLASESAYFSDAVHFRLGAVPGDGVHVIWPMLLGPNRGRYFLLTGQRLSADEALNLGVVSEVLPADKLAARAWELATQLKRQPISALRYTREALTRVLKREMLDSLPLGLAVEGLSAAEYWPGG